MNALSTHLRCLSRWHTSESARHVTDDGEVWGSLYGAAYAYDHAARLIDISLDSDGVRAGDGAKLDARGRWV